MAFEDHDDDLEDLGPFGSPAGAAPKDAAAGAATTPAGVSPPAAVTAAAPSTPAPSAAFGGVDANGTSTTLGPGNTPWWTDQQAQNPNVGGAGQDYTAVQNLSTAARGDTPAYDASLAALGWTGGPLNAETTTRADGSSDGGVTNNNAGDFQKWLDDSGYTSKTSFLDQKGTGDQISALFDKGGNELAGTQRQYASDVNSDAFMGAILAGTAGAGAAAAGAEVAAGEGGAAGLSSADTAALYGDAGYGAAATPTAGGLAGTGLPEFAAYGGEASAPLAGDATGTGIFDAAAATPGAGLSSADTASLYGAEGYGAAATPSELAGGGGMSLIDDVTGGLGTGPTNAGAGFDAATGDASAESLAAGGAEAVGTAGVDALGLGPAGGGSLDALSFDAGGGSVAGDSASMSPSTSSFSPDGAGAGPDGAGGAANAEGSYPDSITDGPDTGNGLSSADKQALDGAKGYGDAASNGGSTVNKALTALKSGGTSAASLAKEYGPIASLGLSALGQMRGNSAQKQLNAIAAPAAAEEKNLLDQFNKGQLSAADQAGIAQWAAKQKAAAQQYLAKAGLSNSSMAQDMMSHIDQQADQMRQQGLNNMLTNGLKAAGVANPTQVAAINAGLKEDAATQAALANFIKTLGSMNTSAPSPAAAPAPSTDDQTGSPG